MPEWVTVARAGDFPARRLLRVALGETRILLADLGGEYRAIGEVCTHEGCPLADGWVEGRSVVCACHGSTFDLDSGAVLVGPAEKDEPRYEVQVVGDEIQIARRP